MTLVTACYAELGQLDKFYVAPIELGSVSGVSFS